MKLVVSHCDSIDSPREDDNLGTMLYNHSRYNLGDIPNPEAGQHGSYEADFKAYLESEGLKLKDVVYTPIYMYEHSGVALSSTGFSCQWDSGQLGWHFVTKADVRSHYNVKRVSYKLEQEVIAALNSELELYNHYVQGNCYEFELYDDNEEAVDSCCGFIGDFENVLERIKEYLPKESRYLADSITYEDVEYN
jgi:hypothetical protein